MIRRRPANERGHVDFGWLQSAHSFSFGSYYDPAHMGFRTLRVINDDLVAPGRGFDTHGHRDMEIVTVVLEGALEHKDSMGNGSVMRPGDVQRMSAGTGVLHSEYNHSDSARVRFLQIWIQPARPGLTPGYEQRHFNADERRDRLRLVASPDGQDGSLTVHQDVTLYAALLTPGEQVTHPLAAGRHAWLQVASGRIQLGPEELAHGDGAAVSDEDELVIRGLEEAELVLFDLA
ncbi:pirin family protein [Haliangium sp.]|uniref:pirin family protein n=1 Tax=Haliangium sp. TaxID=2663208 RepID=UPI003D0D58A9